MQHTLKKMWSWYKELPWWGKALGVLALVGIVLFAGVTLVSRFWSNSLDRSKSDKQHDAVVDTALKSNKEIANTADKLIKTKKREIATKLNQANKIDVDTLTAREKIQKAKTIDELLKLQKELGL